jgi:hypothetical protein
MDMYLFSLISDSHVSLVEETKKMEIKTKRSLLFNGKFSLEVEPIYYCK